MPPIVVPPLMLAGISLYQLVVSRPRPSLVLEPMIYPAYPIVKDLFTRAIKVLSIKWMPLFLLTERYKMVQ
jgi:hypothetical protein